MPSEVWYGEDVLGPPVAHDLCQVIGPFGVAGKFADDLDRLGPVEREQHLAMISWALSGRSRRTKKNPGACAERRVGGGAHRQRLPASLVLGGAFVERTESYYTVANPPFTAGGRERDRHDGGRGGTFSDEKSADGARSDDGRGA